jgi:hypothetical protein
MKKLLLIACFIGISLLHAKPLLDEKIDGSKRSDMGGKSLDVKMYSTKEFTTKSYQSSEKMFYERKTSGFADKKSTAFSKEFPVKSAGMDKEFKTSAFTGFSKNQEFFKIQDKFDTSEKSPITSSQLAADSDKWSRMNQKMYEGKELDVLKQHLQKDKDGQLKKTELEDSTLSVQQIREILNKD